MDEIEMNNVQETKEVVLDSRKNNTNEPTQTKAHFVLIFFIMIVLLGIITLATFFVFVKGEEEVMVPDVTGKDLTVALLEMQANALYPEIQLKYTDLPEHKNKVMSQNPAGRTIAKAGRRIVLTVSQGVIIDRLSDYVGKSIDELKSDFMLINTTSSRTILALKEPLIYKPDASPAGTILEQNPPMGTPIGSDILYLDIVVSEGNSAEDVTVPNVTGLTLKAMLNQMERNKILFDFSPVTTNDSTKIGTIVSQSVQKDSVLPAYSHVVVDIAMPADEINDTVYGIYSNVLQVYPYPLQVRLDALSPDGELSNVVNMVHPGGNITIPYQVPAGSTLILSVGGREVDRTVLK